MKPFDPSGAFRSMMNEGGMRRQAVRGAGITVLGQAMGFTVQLVATVVLARLLMPGDFGVVAMVTTFSLLLMSFGITGFTEAVLQCEHIDHFLASNLFWINIGAGLLLAVGFAAAGSLISRFYGDPRLRNIAVGMALAIFLNSASVQHLALLKRAMRFSLVSANDMLSRAVQVLVSIVLASAGWGYWALVAGAIAQPLSTTIGAWVLCQWLPSYPRRVAGTGSLVRFAIQTYGRYSVNYSTRNLDNLLVGVRLGPDVLGFYKKAYDLFLLAATQLVSPLTMVALSTLSRFKGDVQQYKRYFLRALAVLAFVGMGLGGDLTLVGKDLIRVLLGAKWTEAGRIFTFFGPGIGIMLIYGTNGWIHLSIGRADRFFRWALIEFAVTALLFVLGLHWGAVGIAGAWTLSFWILVVPSFWYAGRPIEFRIATMMAAVWKYAVASLVAGVAGGLIIRQLPSLSALQGSQGATVRVLAVSVLFSVLYLGAIILLHRGSAPLYDFAGLLREMLPWDKLSRRQTASASGSALSPMPVRTLEP